MRKTSLGLALLASGCSLFAGGGSDRPWACTLADGGPDPCMEIDEELRCVVPGGQGVGVCRRCEAVDICDNRIDDDCDGEVDNGSPETCNDRDDDCNGSVDEGLDEDGDGFSWCPTGPPPLDCDDTTATVRPTREGQLRLTDVCDGLNNDCDSSTPDGAPCQPGDNCLPPPMGRTTCDPLRQDCDPVSGSCVDFNCSTRDICAADESCDMSAVPPACRSTDMTCFNPDRECNEGMVCNPATAACVTPQANGLACDYDAECESALCLPIQALRALPAHVEDRNGICGRSCCSDGECTTVERCWASGSGARGCVPEALLEMGSDGPPSVAPCSARRDCSSECQLTQDSPYEVPSRLSLACGNDYGRRIACSPRSQCCFIPFFSCRVPGASCIDGTCQRGSCSESSECPTGICAGGECREACATSGDCGGGGACVYITGRSASRDDYLPACSYTSSGTGTQGASCTTGTDCLDLTCVDASGAAPSPTSGTPTFCADTCCSDTSCQVGEQCRPISVGDAEGSHWENHCLPKPTFGRVGTRP